MLVITRFQVPAERSADFDSDLRPVVDAMAARPGFIDAFVGRNLDDTTLWTLAVSWENVGAYRRALGAYDVKLATAGPYGYAIEEPGAYTDNYGDVAAPHATHDR